MAHTVFTGHILRIIPSKLQIPTLNQRFNSQSYFLESQLSLGDRWQLNSRFDYLVFPQGPFAEQQDFPLWEASASWFAGARKQLEIRLSSFDLLNSNLGISRNAAFNYIENSRMVALGRYFMLIAVYSLKGFGQ